ncbi:MAG: polyhydroxyalkanoic acid system family protein [Planctomycetia bacterium]|nr:polyhydroxyalkanoic acid system family protein [Planctomycetia bacterium]
MTRPITVNVPHSLGKEQARQQIALGFAGISKQLTGGMLGMLSFQERWEEDRLHFEGGGLGQKISGRLDVTADAVHIQVDLPDLLAVIADRIVGTLKQQTQKVLAKQ